MSLTNPFDNTGSVSLATNALQEVSVSTGTFSAEYGNALSGVVNYVTKEGGPKYTASMRLFTGDYISNHDELFPFIRRIDPLNNIRAEGTFGGPAVIDNLSFYASGVYEQGKGYLYGQRLYKPTDFYVSPSELTEQFYRASDSTYIIDPRSKNKGLLSPYYFNPFAHDTSVHQSLPTGDGELVPMTTSDSYNLQANISYRFSSLMKLKYEIVYDYAHSRSGSYYTWRYNPDGRPNNYSSGIFQALEWTHTLSGTMFYTLKGSHKFSDAKTYRFDKINDPGYLPGFYQTNLPNTGFLTGGVYLGRTTRSTESTSGKFDLVAQLFDIHEVKFGIEVILHTLNYEDYDVEFYDPVTGRVVTNFTNVYSDSIHPLTRVPTVENGSTYYKYEPKQFAVYVQDKVELAKSLILNAGLRYEYFDPAAKFNTQLGTDVASHQSFFLTSNLKQASAKHTLSPRISIAYPITDQGVIRFSYGHFYQFGDLSSLYRNPNFYSPDGLTSGPTFGNADVRPQRSIQYEIGLMQGLSPDLRLEVVGFSKDVKDYIFTQSVRASLGDVQYNVLTNLDYSNTRGITISLLQRRSPGGILSGSLDYTFQIAEGNRTEPILDFFYSEKSGKSAETFLVPLSFDRSHTISGTLTLSEPDNYAVSSIWRYQTGTPYTPSLPASLSSQMTKYIQNTSNKPIQWNCDIKMEKFLSMDQIHYSVFIQVDNLFDTENEVAVYSNSGRALYNADIVANPTRFNEITRRINNGDPGMIPMSAITNYDKNPNNISRPRLVRFGVSLYF
jgi:outer membrane receptor protein involved in Fe transport